MGKAPHTAADQNVVIDPGILRKERTQQLAVLAAPKAPQCPYRAAALPRPQ